MTLTTGATLQEGRYVIQSILSQDEWGITYGAMHLHLDQSVVIQTLRTDRQELPEGQSRTGAAAKMERSTRAAAFLTEVRRAVRQSRPETPPILDCFLEAGMPFVVLLLSEQEHPPAIATWLPEHLRAAPEPDPAPEISVQDAGLALPTPHRLQGVQTALTPPETLLQRATIIEQENLAAASKPLQMSSSIRSQHPLEGVTELDAPRRADTLGGSPAVAAAPPTRPPRKRWLPLALAFTSVFAGLGGASLGWMLRMQSLQPASEQTSGILAPLLNNEQSFPPLEDWSGDDPPDLAAPMESETSPYRAPVESERRDRRPEVPVEEPVDLEVPTRRRTATREAPPSREFIPPSEQEAAPEPAPVESQLAPLPEAPPAAELPPPEPAAPPAAPPEPPAKIKPQPEAAPPPEPPAEPPPAAPPAAIPTDPVPVVQ